MKASKQIVSALMAFAVLLAVSGKSTAQILYVTNGGGGSVGAYNATTGAAINASFITGLNAATGIAVSGNRLYFASFHAGNGTVGLYNATTGAAINASLVGLTAPFGVAVSGNSLYIANFNGSSTVGVYNATTGAVINASLVAGQSSLTGVAVSGNNLYVANGNVVGEYNASNGAPFNSSFISALSEPQGVAVSANNLFVTSFGNSGESVVGEYNATTGTTINASFITNSVGQFTGVAVSGNRMYVADNTNGTVGVYNATTGAAINTTFITGLQSPEFIAISTPADEAISAMSSPAPGSTLASGNVTFNWGAGFGVTQNLLAVGSTIGGSDLFGGVVTGTSKTVTVPTDGRRIFVRLYSVLDGQYQFNAYTYDAFSGADPKAAMQSPPSGSTFTSGNVTFSWSAGTGVSEVVLGVGSTVDTYDLHAAVETGISDTVTLPTDGRPIYVTLFSKINGVFQYNSYVYAAAQGSTTPAEALITQPINGSILTSTDLALKWVPGSAASEYIFWAGSKPNGYDLYAAVQSFPLVVGVPPLYPQLQIPLDGRRIYVTLFSKVNGALQRANYYFDTTR